MKKHRIFEDTFNLVEDLTISQFVTLFGPDDQNKQAVIKAVALDQDGEEFLDALVQFIEWKVELDVDMPLWQVDKYHYVDKYRPDIEEYHPDIEDKLTENHVIFNDYVFLDDVVYSK